VSSLLISGFWHERRAAPTHQRAVEHNSQAPAPRTRFASNAQFSVVNGPLFTDPLSIYQDRK
jgi:hypothetical protein